MTRYKDPHPDTAQIVVRIGNHKSRAVTIEDCREWLRAQNLSRVSLEEFCASLLPSDESPQVSDFTPAAPPPQVTSPQPLPVAAYLPPRLGSGLLPSTPPAPPVVPTQFDAAPSRGPAPRPGVTEGTL